MNDYQHEQWAALQLVRNAIAALRPAERRDLADQMRDYLMFRERVDLFLNTHLSQRCTASCYENRRSACCSKDGIVTFWADVVVNVLHGNPEEIADLEEALNRPVYDYKCTYLGRHGCRWRIRPLGCAMFLCDEVQAEVFEGRQHPLRDQWLALAAAAKAFRWPDKPVLFDRLEIFFIERGCRSTLMYINTSPGLMRIKKQAGLTIPAQ